MDLARKLAQKIAKDIMGCGSEFYKGIPHRIQFMGGEYPDNETAMGGLNKQAMSDVIEASINEIIDQIGQGRE